MVKYKEFYQGFCESKQKILDEVLDFAGTVNIINITHVLDSYHFHIYTVWYRDE